LRYDYLKVPKHNSTIVMTRWNFNNIFYIIFPTEYRPEELEIHWNYTSASVTTETAKESAALNDVLLYQSEQDSW